jgi:single-stranded-DNA-specific exonuclease
MAAGFSIQEENIPVFRERISRAVIESGPIPDSSMQIDLNISFSEITEEFVEEVERLAPFGPGNPPIIMLCEDLRIAHHKLVGRDSEHLSLVVEDRTGHKQQVIWWQGSELVDQLPSEYFDLAFITRNTTFRGKREVQIEWLDYKRRERINDEYEDRKSSIGIVDYRSETDPLERLRKIIDSVGINEIEVWAEGKGLEELKKYGMTAHSRIDIAQSSNLVVFTKPPGGEEIREVIKKVQPSKIYFFSETPGLTDMNEYLSQLSGLVKYSITHYGGELKLRRLAGLTAQKLSSVRLGVEWLAAGGYIQVVFKSDGTSQVVDGGEKSNYESDRLSKKLRDLFEETAAFRDYYEKMDAESLLELINEVE